MTSFDMILKTHGETVTLTEGDNAVNVKALIIPGGVSFDDSIIDEPTELGNRDRSRFLCIIGGDIPKFDVRKTHITARDGEYEIINAQRFTVDRIHSHWECMLRRREELFGVGN